MIKNLIQGIEITIFCFLLFLLPVKAADPSVSLKEDGNDVKAVLELPDTIKSNEVVSLKLSFDVDKKPAKEDISFDFDNGIKSEVQEFRYHEESGRLNIYISGTTNLFQEEKLSLGTIVLSKNIKDATVRVVEDSLVTVNSAFDMEEIKLSESSSAKPGTTNPENPTTPGTVTNPENPTTPGTATNPENPTTPGTAANPENPTTPGTATKPGNNGNHNWESNDSGSYSNRPRGSRLIPVDDNNNTPKPVMNVNPNPNPQEPAGSQTSTQPTTTAEDKTQTTANSENSALQPSANERDSQLPADNQNNSQNSTSDRNGQPAENRTNNQNNNNSNNSNPNNGNNNRNNNDNNNNNDNYSASNEIDSSNIGENVTTALLLLESQPQSEEQITTDTETESDSTEPTQEAAYVSNPNEKEKSSSGNMLLMIILGFILVIAAGGAVFVFKLTETPKKKR